MGLAQHPGLRASPGMRPGLAIPGSTAAGAVWSGLAIDQDTDTLFVAPGNPGPDMVLQGRKGRNLYTNSLVALDVSGKTPK